MPDAALHEIAIYKNAFECAPFGICLVAPSGHCVQVNQALADLLGLHPNQLLATGLNEYSHPVDLQQEQQLQRACLAGDNNRYRFEKRFIHHKGMDIWTEVSGTFITTDDAPQGYFVIQIVDISAKQDAQNALRESEERLQLACRGTNDGIWDWQIPTDEMYYSPRFLELLGYQSDAMPRYFADFEKVFHPDEFNMMMRAFQDHLQDKLPLDIECRLQHSDQSYRWFRIRGQSCWDEMGQPLRMSGSIMDISAEKAIKDSVYSLNLKLESRVKARTAELEKSQRYNRTLFEESPVGLVLSDLEGHLVDCNQAFAKIVGYDIATLLEKSYADLLPDPSKPSPIQLANPEHSARIEGQESLFIGSQGQLIPVFFSALIIEQQGTSYIWSAIEDIRWRKQAEQQLIDAKEKAENANQAKSEFLATMSHEIRTPMNGIVGMIEVLNREDLSPSQNRMLNTIKQAGLSLLTIINDILDLSKIEAGKLSIVPEPTYIPDLLEQVMQTLAITIYEKNQHVSLLYPADFPRALWADPIRLKQIFLNLMGNAIKFVSAQKDYHWVKIKLQHQPFSSGIHAIRIQIQDNGIGIEPKQQARLFHAFNQADSSTTRKFGGTGLGLVITKRLIDLMHGQITLQSEVQQGTEFNILLTLKEADTPLIPVKNTVHPPCYLCIEQALLREQIEYYLQQWHYDYQCIDTQALATTHQLNSYSQGILLFDNPNIGHIPHTTSLKQIQLSASAVDFEPLNANYWLLGSQPLLPSLLHSVLLRLAQSENTDPILTKQPQLTSLPDRNYQLLIAEDNPVNQEVLLSQLQLLGLTATITENGKEAFHYWLSNPVQLLLTDLHMPEMDGYQLIKAIREHEQKHQKPHTIIIGVTADVVSEQVQQLNALGIDKVLTKPILLDALASVLQDSLADVLVEPLHKSADNAPVIEPPVVTPLFKDYNPDMLNQVIGPDRQQQAMIMDLFINSLHKKQEALQEAIAEQDQMELKAQCHALKSSARSIGALPLTAYCQQLEDHVDKGVMIDWRECEQTLHQLAQETLSYIDYWKQL